METQTNQPLLPIRVVGELSTIESLVVADGLGIKHKNLLETIRTHQTAIEADFGLIAFETRKIESTTGRGRPETVAHLTEDQALFIGALSRNSKQVVEFKKVLVKSFSEARKQLLEQASRSAVTTEQVLIQLVSQSNQLLANQQEQLNQLRSDLDRMIHHPTPTPVALPPVRPRSGQQLGLPGIPMARPRSASLRQLINQRIDEYCDLYGYDRRETWNYLHKRLFEVYSLNVHRLKRVGSESLLDVIERYGRLNDLYELVVNELSNSE